MSTTSSQKTNTASGAQELKSSSTVSSSSIGTPLLPGIPDGAFVTEVNILFITEGSIQFITEG